MSPQTKSYVYALSAVGCWSTVATAFKIALRTLTVLQLLFIATITAALVLMMLCLVTGRLARLGEHPISRYSRAAILGMLNPVAYYLVLFGAYERLPAQIAQTVNYSWAIALMLLSVPLLHHRLTRTDLIAAAASYTGVVVICLGGVRVQSASLDFVGLALALGSTVIWALYWIAKTADPIDPIIGLTVSFLAATPLVTAAWLLGPGFTSMTPTGVAAALYVGVFEMGFPFVLWLLALQHSGSAARVSTLIFLSPFLSLFLIHRVLGESIVASTYLGLALIVVGLALQQRARDGSPGHTARDTL